MAEDNLPLMQVNKIYVTFRKGVADRESITFEGTLPGDLSLRIMPGWVMIVRNAEQETCSYPADIILSVVTK